MKKENVITLAAVLLSIAALACSCTRDTIKNHDASGEVVDSVFSKWNSNDTPGAAILVIRDKKILLEKCYGLRNIRSGTEIEPDTVFLLGSITKQFTAMAVMMLAERGQISYEDSIHTYLPGFQDYAKGITIRQLLVHTGGLPEFDALFLAKGLIDSDWPRSLESEPGAFQPTTDDALDVLYRAAEPRFMAGTEWEYSNSGYVVLARIVEVVSKRSLPEFLDENILEGGFTRYDRFVYLPIGVDNGMLKVWQAAILSLFLRKELIDRGRVNMLLDWKHSGFSIESETRLFNKADREALGQYVVRGAICAEKIQYDPASDTVIWTAAPRGFYKGKSETFKGFEFVDQLVAHLPPRRVQLVRRYGVYAGKVRKQWQHRPSIYRLASEGWRENHPIQSQIIQETPRADVESAEVPDAWSKLRKQSWARLLQKVYEVDPFICPKCQGAMSVVAIIEEPNWF